MKKKRGKADELPKWGQKFINTSQLGLASSAKNVVQKMPLFATCKERATYHHLWLQWPRVGVQFGLA